ncbi:MAG: fasciclin domain-containing protein [Pseudomonadota bacterium]
MKNIFRAAAAATLLATTTLTFQAQAAHHEAGHEMEKPAGTIVDVAAGNGDFSTLVAAVKAAGLVDVLAGEGPYTVFAPTNAAFAKLPAGTVEDLLKPENKAKLQAILKYHVVPGKVMAADVVGLESATTAEGSDVSIAASDSGVKIDNANVIATDVAASNGVIHAIDAVILPAS